jgi:flavin reductase (DIM6/NTAB) family NADH-FMN oxidoreductase RutF
MSSISVPPRPPREKKLSRKKPLNRTNPAIWSIASAYGGKFNMNICSYVTGISMKPSRMVVGVYKNTLTLELVQQSNEMVLQLLAIPHYKLVKLLGQTSGHKKEKLGSIKNAIINYRNHQCLEDALSLLHLKIIQQIDAGDHWLMLCDICSFINLHEGIPLTMDVLREKKLVRI